MHFILIAVLSNTMLGEYESQIACEQAIRSRLSVNIAKESIANPKIQQMLDTVLLYQREYMCIPKK